MDSIGNKLDSEQEHSALQKLEDAAKQVGKAWSGSWLGYHSRVYYRNFQSPPPGARFSQEWGFMDVSFGDTRGDWAEYDYDSVRTAIHDIAGNPDLDNVRKQAQLARGDIEDKRTELLSSISTALNEREDPFLLKLKDKVETASIPTATDFIRYYRPSGKLMSRDMPAIGQGFRTPPHFAVLAEVMANRSPGKACEELSKAAKQASAHLNRRERFARTERAIGDKVFIGHGRSSIWKDLKDFIQERLDLPWDEFNRIPVAGVTNIARLSQMLEEAGIAFLILTAEDEKTDGTLQARMNVTHEAGLFQGRLGFTKAIILLEEGCEEFSNIKGLGQIRFPKGNIKQAFEEIRRVLEREGLLNA